MWRFIYSQKKLSNAQRNALQAILDEMSFSCGAPLQDLDLLSDLINTVYVCDMNCQELIEALYYSAKYKPICAYCARPQPFTDDKQYPLCVDCKDKAPVLKK